MQMVLKTTGVLLFATALTALGAQDPLPEAPGKPILVRVCSACHDLDTATGTRHTRNEWRQVIESMIDRGAKASDEEIVAITGYLTAYAGLVNVNKAAAAEIETVLGIAAAQAAAVVDYRAAHGDFKDLDTLKQVPGIDAVVLEERKDRITYR